MASFSLETLITDVEQRASEPLDRLRVAVSKSHELHALGDDLIGRFVSDARRAGCSWAEVGDALGVSKQAAHQRFPTTGAEAWPPAFREDAQRAMGAAAEHARRLGHDHLGTEHRLLALAEQADSLAGRVLGDLELTPGSIELQLDTLVARGNPSSGTVSVSARGKRALEQARRDARRLGQRCPGSEHLLIALAADTDGAAARILHELDVTAARLRDALAARLGPDAHELADLVTRRHTRLRRRR
jgi:Clp amino terminal domain, pathogenicity island component